MKRSTVILVSFTLFSLILTTALGQSTRHSSNAYKVVINHEEQYSVLPLNQKTPQGWEDTQMRGSQSKCQDYIEEVWTDMRPLSIRKQNLPKDTRYVVIINHEEQYLVWPEGKGLPKGWNALKVKGSLKTCSDYIEEVWTDMRPLSVRKK